MKYILISLCLLLVLITSKVEFKDDLSLKKSFFLQSFLSESQSSDCQADTKEVCIETQQPEDNRLCCYYERKINNRIFISGCESIKKEMVENKDLFGMKEFKSYQREIRGYGKYGKDVKDSEPNYETDEIRYTCEGNTEFNSTFNNSYSENEIKTLKNESYCLYINENNKTIIINNYTKNNLKCGDKFVLNMSNGIECGFREYNITLSYKNEPKTNLTVQTCDLFNLKLYSKLSKIYTKKIFGMNEDVEKYVKEYVNNNLGEDYKIESYVSKLYNKYKNESATYDSEKDKVDIEPEQISAHMPTFCKILFLLLLILF